MDKRDSLIMRFFDKWKKKQIGKLGKKLMKDNPQLEKDMEKIAKSLDNIGDTIKKGKNPFK